MNLHAVHSKLLTVGIVLLAVATVAVAQVPGPPQELDPLDFSGPDPTAQYRDIQIEQKLDAQVPLDLVFTDANGETKPLREFMNGKPVVLAMVYYECPMLCTQVLNGLGVALEGMRLQLGEEYNVLTVSVDPRETPELAAGKKENYLEELNIPGDTAGWHFLTGEEANIETLATAVGFRYAWNPALEQYAHAAGIMVLTPEGRVSRYYYGIEYFSRDLQFGLMEASENRIGSLADNVVLLCFQYDPAAGGYGFYVFGALRLFAALTVLGLAVFWGISFLQSKRGKSDGGVSSGTAAQSEPSVST